MADLIVGGILIVVVGAAISYIVKAKKKGIKCIGCPAAGQCAGGSKAQGEGICGGLGTEERVGSCNGNCAHCKGKL